MLRLNNEIAIILAYCGHGIRSDIIRVDLKSVILRMMGMSNEEPTVRERFMGPMERQQD